MNADGKIYIVVTDKLPTGTTPQPVSDASDTESSDNSLASHWARDRLVNLVKQTATRAVMYSLSNIGNFTGDYIQQTHINDTLHNLNALKGIATATIAGGIHGGWIGAVIGFAVSTINETVGSAFEIHSNRVNNRKTNYEIEQLRNRAGLNSILDGSRGTEN